MALRRRLTRFAALAAAAVIAVAPAAGAEEKKLGWADTAEFSYVATAGNTETQTLGFKNTLMYTWEQALFTLRAGGIRVESTKETAVGTPANFNIDEETTLSAENYYLNGRYDREISKRFFWFLGAGWDRNEFAGIEDRYTAFGGVGNIWVDTDTVKFRTDYAATYTDQTDVAPQPGEDGQYFGLRLSYAYLHKFGEATTFTSDLVIDSNADETQDVRGNMINSVAVSLTKRMALKVSLQWLYDNKPSFREFELEDPIGTPTGQKVSVELDELDSILTTSLVINF